MGLDDDYITKALQPPATWLLPEGLRSLFLRGALRQTTRPVTPANRPKCFYAMDDLESILSSLTFAGAEGGSCPH